MLWVVGLFPSKGFHSECGFHFEIPLLSLRASHAAFVSVEDCMRSTSIVSLCLLLQGRDLGC